MTACLFPGTVSLGRQFMCTQRVKCTKIGYVRLVQVTLVGLGLVGFDSSYLGFYNFVH